MKIVVFLQARINSKRFPAKVLKKILGKTVIELIVERLRKIKRIDNIVLVTGPQEKNKLLIDEAKKLNLEYYCGSEENILDRMYKASLKINPDIIIRITSDCPLIDFNVINKGLDIFLKSQFDILNNNKVRTFPHGFDFEIFKNETLHMAWQDNRKKFKNKDEFYHTFITPAKYMFEEKKFKNYNLLNDKNLSNIRLTLDYPEDLELITKIFSSLYNKNQDFALEEILDLIKENPSLLDINKNRMI